MPELFASEELSSLIQILFIDLVLAGDNAIVVGMVAASVDPSIRRKVICFGIAGAVVLRISFALLTTQLLAVIGLTLAGGLLLLWVCWKMYRELREAPVQQDPAAALPVGGAPAGKTIGRAMLQIVAADVSMSLDNVLAVAGAANGHMVILSIGLVLSIVLMGIAANFIAKLLARHHWIAWIGLFVIVYVAVGMIWQGSQQVACAGNVSTLCLSQVSAGPGPAGGLQ